MIHPYVRNIFRGMQTHGLIVANNGSDLYVTGAMDSRWNNNDISARLPLTIAVG